jgi:hypothetical protein
MKTTVGSTVRLGRKTNRDEELEQSRRALPKNLIRPLPYMITNASGSEDLLSHSLVHAGAPNEVDYGGDASSEMRAEENPRQHGPRPRRMPESVTAAHNPASCDAYVKDSVKRSVFLCNKKISSVSRLNSANRGTRVVTCRVETSEREGGACVWHFSSHSLTKWCNTPPYILLYISSIFHMGLNLALTSCLCAVKNLGYMSHALTHIGFDIS